MKGSALPASGTLEAVRWVHSEMMYRCFLSQGLPALDLSFLLSTGAAGLQGRGIFQHHTEAVRSLWVGAAREVGLRRSELKGYNDNSAQTAPGLTHIQALALRSATANLGSSGSARRHHPGSAGTAQGRSPLLQSSACHHTSLYG
jgi:hypothetical protein